MHTVGSPYERGFSHGTSFAPLIREHIRITCKMAPGYEGQVSELLGRIRKNLGAMAPAYLEELRGIAEGAGLETEEIMKLSFWPEVTTATVGLTFCSLVSFSDLPGGPILGKNSDHPLTTVRFVALQRVDNPQGQSYVRGTFLGTAGTRAGINSSGLAITSATIVPDASNWDGVPLMAVGQSILEQCSTVEEAIALAKKMPTINYGAHLEVGDAGGNIADIECMPDRIGVRRPKDGLLFNTNHPLAPNTRDHSAASPALRGDSHARIARLEQLISGTPRTIEGMKSILRDHTEPGAICQHGGPAELHTTSAYILLPAERTMLMAAGCPCQHEFVPIRVAE